MRRPSAPSRRVSRATLLLCLACAAAFSVPAVVRLGGQPAQAATGAPQALQTAFKAVYPTGRATLTRDDQEIQVAFTPKLLHRLDGRTQVLVSEGRALSSDCHMCQGAFSVAYFVDGALSGPPFVGFGSMGGLGVPPEVSLLTRLGPTPLLLVRNSFSNQGETEMWIDLVRLGPTRSDVAVVAEAVPLDHDNAGSADDCAITGRIVARGKAGDFAVRHRGSFRGEVLYSLRDGRYVATPEPPALYERCPDR